ncbi:MAG: hypothetical protein ABJC62_08505 [Frankiaceae bacterium]
MRLGAATSISRGADDRAALGDNHRVEGRFSDLREILDQLGDTQQHARQRLDVRGHGGATSHLDATMPSSETPLRTPRYVGPAGAAVPPWAWSVG